MNRRAAALVVGAAVILAVVAAVWWWGTGSRDLDTPATDEPREVRSIDTTTVELFFPNTAGWLGTEIHELPAAASAEERAMQVASALLSGPAESAHQAPLGEGVEVASLHLSDSGIVYLDLAATQMATPPVSGTRGELLVVYSFVNSILANVPEARGVVLLWNGNQRPTFAGHIDTTRPLPAESRWVAKRAS